MSKETFYFSHDYNARNDEKIKYLLRKHGLEGYGIFWALVEDLYNNANVLRTDYERIAYELRSTENICKSVVEDFDLFEINDGFFGSLSIQRRLDERAVKSAKAKDSAKKRWSAKNANASENDANASKNDAIKDIKERKGKEIKEIKKGTVVDKSTIPPPSSKKDITVRKAEFKAKLEPHLETYGKDMLNDFYSKWTELTKSGKQMRFELEKTFEVKKRLVTWKRNSEKWDQPKIGQLQTSQKAEEIKTIGAKYVDQLRQEKLI